MRACEQHHELAPQHTHKHILHSHQTPASSPLSSSRLPFLPLHSHSLPFSLVPPTRTSPTKMDTVLGARNPFGNVCLICCRGGNCDSRTCRRNLNRAPTDWKNPCRRLCLVQSVSVPIAVSVCLHLRLSRTVSVFFQCLCAGHRSDPKHVVGTGFGMGGEAEGRFRSGLTAKAHCQKFQQKRKMDRAFESTAPFRLRVTVPCRTYRPMSVRSALRATRCQT